MPALAEQLRQLIDGAAPPVTVEEISTRCNAPERLLSGRTRVNHAEHHDHRMHAAIAAVLVLAVVGASTWFVASRPSPARHRHAATPSHNPPAPSRNVPAPTWQLIASLSGTQFQLGTGNPGSVSEVNCGGRSTCFLSTFYGLGGNSALSGSTYMSHDGGHSWAQTTLPSGVASETAVSCVNDTWCAAGGGLLDPSSGDPAAKKAMRDPELLVTTDAGASWTMHALPIAPDIQQLPAYGSLPAETTYWPGLVDAIDCTAVGVCNVIAHVTNSHGPSSGILPDTLIFLRTTDGGTTWTQTVLPRSSSDAGLEEVPALNGASLSCPTQSACVVISTLGIVVSHGQVAAWRSSDSGRSWQETQIAGVPGVAPGLSCPDPETCWAPTGRSVLHSVDGGASWTLVNVPPVPPVNGRAIGVGWITVSCTSAEVCFLGGQPGMIATTDGGASWSSVTLPQGVGAVQSISCEVQGMCIALANPPGQQSGYGSSLVLTNGTTSVAPARPAPRQP